MPIPPILVVGFLAWILHEGLRKRRIFVSYYYREDAALKRLIQAWSSNPSFDFEIDDVSLDATLVDADDDEIREAIGDRLDAADVFLCLVGEQTHRRPWVAFEIEEAVGRSLPVVAVKSSKGHVSPRELKGVGASWVYSFEFEEIREAMESAS